MSRVYFHTPSETVEVYGSERAHLGQLCRGFSGGFFNMLTADEKLAAVPADHYIHELPIIASRAPGWGPALDHVFDLFQGGFSDDKFADGEQIFGVVLNTVLKFGSDPMRLAARIHGQCEIHGYVEPEDGEFIASLIEKGIEDGVFRESLPLDGIPTEHPSGWREACRVLRAGEIVVTSYSVCESFPNQGIAQEGGAYSVPVCDACGGNGKPNPQMKYTDVAYDYCTTCDGDGKLWDAWYDIPEQEQWDLALKGLRAVGGRRWSEDGWGSFYFDNGKNALDYQRVKQVV